MLDFFGFFLDFLDVFEFFLLDLLIFLKEKRFFYKIYLDILEFFLIKKIKIEGTKVTNKQKGGTRSGNHTK